MNKTVKSITAAALAILLSAGMMGGCTGQSVGKTADANGTVNSAGSGPVTITIMQANSPDKAYFDKLGAEFTKRNPNIKVEVIPVPYDQFDSKLQTLVASGTAPDVTTHVQLMGFMDFYSKGLLTDLTPYIEKYKFDYQKLGIPKNVMDTAVIDGKTYGIPLNTFTSVLIYNKDIFDKAHVAYPPSDYNDKSWTFDKMVEVAKKLTSGKGGDKVYGLEWDWSAKSPLQDTEYFGPKLFNMDNNKKGYAASSNMAKSDVISAYQRIADLAFVDGVSPNPATLTAMTGSNDSDPLLTGKIAMEVEGAWGLSGLNDLPFRVGVAAVPIGANEKARDVLFTDPYFVLKGSKHPEEAFKFISFMAEPEIQKKMIEYSEGNPPSSTLALDTYYNFFSSVDPADLKNVITGGLQYGVEDVEHLITGSGQIHNLLANELTNVTNGKSKAADVCPALTGKLDATLKEILANGNK